MSGVSERRLLVVQLESFEWQCVLNKIVCNSNKNGIMMNVDVSVKNQMIGVLVKKVICGFLAPEIVNGIKHVKLTLKVIPEKNIKSELVNEYQHVKMKY